MKKMQCKKLFLCCGIAMITMLGLYGCAAKSDKNTGNNQNGDSQVGNSNTESLQSGNANEKIEQNRHSEYTISDITGIEKMELDHEYGNIILGISEDENINIKASSDITAYSQDELNEIVDNIDVKSNVLGNKCVLKVIHKGEGMELWDWLERKQKERNVSVDLEILIPSNFTSVDISVDSGTIQVSGLEGAMDLETDHGDINVVLRENLSKNAFIELEADNGNIGVTLKDNKIEYSKEESNHIRATINGVCTLEAATDNGNVNITK